MLRPLLATLVMAALAGAASSEAAAAPRVQPEPAGGIGIRLVEAPVEARDDPRAAMYIVDHLAPGTVIERRIEVSNTTTSPQQVALYAAAASIDDGSFVGAADDTPNELSSWTSVTPDGQEIAAGATVTALVKTSVPADAAPGEQYAVVWAEARSDDAGQGVVQVSRVGIRLYVSVGPGGPPAADFTIDSLTAERSNEGLPTISASVHNTGGRALDMSGSLLLTGGPGGLNAGPFTAELGSTLAIGDTQPVTITLDEQLPAGPWDVAITLKSGLTERHAEATVTFPEKGAADPVATIDDAPGRWWLAPAALGVLAVVLVGGWVLLRRSRFRSARRLVAR